jgi:hypothetical protein
VTSINFLSGGDKAIKEAVESTRGKGPIAAHYIETLANPTNGMVDLERARKIVSGLHGNRPIYHLRKYNVRADLSGPSGTWC